MEKRVGVHGTNLFIIDMTSGDPSVRDELCIIGNILIAQRQRCTHVQSESHNNLSKLSAFRAERRKKFSTAPTRTSSMSFEDYASSSTDFKLMVLDSLFVYGPGVEASSLMIR